MGLAQGVDVFDADVTNFYFSIVRINVDCLARKLTVDNASLMQEFERLQYL